MPISIPEEKKKPIPWKKVTEVNKFDSTNPVISSATLLDVFKLLKKGAYRTAGGEYKESQVFPGWNEISMGEVPVKGDVLVYMVGTKYDHPDKGHEGYINACISHGKSPLDFFAWQYPNCWVMYRPIAQPDTWCEITDDKAVFQPDDVFMEVGDNPDEYIENGSSEDNAGWTLEEYYVTDPDGVGYRTLKWLQSQLCSTGRLFRFGQHGKDGVTKKNKPYQLPGNPAFYEESPIP